MSDDARRCKNCRSKSRVLYTRDEGAVTVRERECKGCGARWSTKEERAHRGWVTAG